MAAKKRRKRRARRVRGASARSKARHNPAALASPLRSSPDAQQSAARVAAGNGTETPGSARPRRKGGAIPATPGPTFRQPSLIERVLTVFLPGRVFFAMGRPASGIVCCVLQASLLGWVPAALWAVRAQRHVAGKQRGLAARLRPL